MLELTLILSSFISNPKSHCALYSGSSRPICQGTDGLVCAYEPRFTCWMLWQNSELGVSVRRLARSPVFPQSIFGQQVRNWRYLITVSIYVSPLPIASPGLASSFPPLITEPELSLKIIFHQLLAHPFCCQCHTDLLWQVPRASFITLGVAAQPGFPLYP